VRRRSALLVHRACHRLTGPKPALLYLSPACILSFVATAAARGELEEAWAWSDDPAEQHKAELANGTPVSTASEEKLKID
jgi:hypothetical protein